MILCFANCELDVKRRELHRQGEAVHIEPQVLDLLLYLINNRDRVVTKEELFQAVWDERIVSEGTLSSRISAARQAIGDDGKRQIYLRTVPRRGFRFHVAVEERVSAQSALATKESAGSSRRVASNLPVWTTDLVGREADMHEVAALLQTSRLVTLTGAGGVGKTRLAIHVAARTATKYPDGVWLIEFAALNVPDAAVHSVAGVLGVSRRTGKTIEESVIAALRARRVLLMLDNCEHLIEPIAVLVRDILAHCPLVTLMATSREALLVSGEQEWPVTPLNCDGLTSHAAQLFAERARAVSPDFSLNEYSPAVSEICRRVDGIPLAIELAAARTRALSPSQIRDLLGDGFRLLARGVRPAEERHLSLRRAMQWSYDLLAPAERTLLENLSVFAGGFTLQAAQRVCGDDLPSADMIDLLDSLVRKSLVTVNRSGSAVRYGQLETIRRFGDEQLTANRRQEAVRSRHAQFFAEDSELHFELWLSPDQNSAYQWLDHELGNLRAAFRWATAHDEVDSAIRIASNVGDIGRFRMRDEAANWAAEIVDAARSIRHPRLVVLLTWAASSAWSAGELEQAERYGNEAIALAGDEGMDRFVWAFTDLAMVACYQGDGNRAIEWGRAGAIHLADERDRFCLSLLPYFLAVGGHAEEAMTLADQIVSTVESTGIPSSISAAFWAKGKAFASTDTAKALAAYERSFAIARESGNLLWEAMAVVELTALQATRMDPIAALASFRRMMAHWRRSKDLALISHGIGGLIVLFERLGLGSPAAVLSGVVVNTVESNTFEAQLSEVITGVRQTLGDAKFEEANRRGAAMELHEVYDYALEEVQRALVAAGMPADGE